MRKSLSYIALAVLSLSVSCQKGGRDNMAADSFTATCENGTGTKTLASGTSVLWSPADRIEVFAEDGSSAIFTSSNSEPAAEAVFSGHLEEGSGKYYAVYPAREDNAFADGTITLTLPETQTAVAGTFASALFPAIAVSGTKELHFKNLCGGVYFSVSRDGIDRITLQGNHDEALAGRVKVELGDDGIPAVKEVIEGKKTVVINAPEGGFVVGEFYYAVVLPQVFSDGLTLTFHPASGSETIYRIESARTIKRSVFAKLDKADTNAYETYEAPAFREANITQTFKCYWTRKPWYPEMPDAKKRFIYPHMLTSYLAMEWYPAENMEYIIAGEKTIEIPCENVGWQDGFTSYHADSGYSMIQDIAPNAIIKVCGYSWAELEDYLKHYPNKLLMVSLATDFFGASRREDLTDIDEYLCLKRILELDNVIISAACGNLWPNGQGGYLLITPNETYPEASTSLIGSYGSVGVNSLKNNKICVVGYDPTRQNIFGQDEDSRRPIGFGKGNLVMPMMVLAADNSEEDRVFILDDTTSSFPTAALSGTLGNFLSILMKTHPGITLEGANTILQENYLREDKFKYVDESDGSIKEGGDWYFFDTDKFFEYEVLHKAEVDAALAEIPGQAGNDGAAHGAGNDGIALPSGFGLCYTGPGIQFEVSGIRYDMSEKNRAAFEAAWKAEPASINWYFSPARASAFGTTGSATLSVRLLDTQARLIPHMSRTVQMSL